MSAEPVEHYTQRLPLLPVIDLSPVWVRHRTEIIHKIPTCINIIGKEVNQVSEILVGFISMIKQALSTQDGKKGCRPRLVYVLILVKLGCCEVGSCLRQVRIERWRKRRTRQPSREYSKS